MPGKYTAFRGKFPESPRSEYWAKIDAHKAEYLAMGIDNFEKVGQYIQDVSKAKDEMEAEAKELGYQLSALERIMLDLLDREKLDSVALASGNFSRQDKLNVAMEDRGVFYAWLKANSMDDLFSVNANTAAMIVKEAVLADKELPPGTSVSVASVLQRRKTKGE
jgi:hypothetical protein